MNVENWNPNMFGDMDDLPDDYVNDYQDQDDTMSLSDFKNQ